MSSDRDLLEFANRAGVPNLGPKALEMMQLYYQGKLSAGTAVPTRVRSILAPESPTPPMRTELETLRVRLKDRIDLASEDQLLGVLEIFALVGTGEAEFRVRGRGR